MPVGVLWVVHSAVCKPMSIRSEPTRRTFCRTTASRRLTDSRHARYWSGETKALVAQNTNEIINEVIKTRELLRKNPGDRNMQAFMGRLHEKLKKAYEKEKANVCTNPLRAAVDLLSLSPKELEVWMKRFEEIDKEKEGSYSAFACTYHP